MQSGPGRNHQYGKRHWVKLWTNEWLDGTTRYQMSDAQRAFWIDLLAMAGRSRFPGLICAGRDGKHFVGYPLNRFQSLMAGPIEIEATLELFERTGKVKITVTSEEPKLFVVELLNWRKYQSDLVSQAERSRKYRERKKRCHGNITRRITATSPFVTGVEEEGDREKDNDKDKGVEEGTASSAAVPNNNVTNAFESLNVAAFGPKAFQVVWTEQYQQMGSWEARAFVEAMESALQICRARKIKVPRKFYELKRQVEKLEVEQCFRKTPL